MNLGPGSTNPGNIAPVSAVQAPQAPSEANIPDYEVISRGDGSDS